MVYCETCRLTKLWELRVPFTQPSVNGKCEICGTVGMMQGRPASEYIDHDYIAYPAHRASPNTRQKRLKLA